jgi:hypothetical protein
VEEGRITAGTSRPRPVVLQRKRPTNASSVRTFSTPRRRDQASNAAPTDATSIVTEPEPFMTSLMTPSPMNRNIDLPTENDGPREMREDVQNRLFHSSNHGRLRVTGIVVRTPSVSPTAEAPVNQE